MLTNYYYYYYYWIILTWNHIIMYKLLILDSNTWNIAVCKLLELNRNTWYNINIGKQINIITENFLKIAVKNVSNGMLKI